MKTAALPIVWLWSARIAIATDLRPARHFSHPATNNPRELLAMSLHKAGIAGWRFSHIGRRQFGHFVTADTL
jgi:hypothetical protein